MPVIKTDRDIIVHKRANGDLWVYERGGLPAFSKKRVSPLARKRENPLKVKIQALRKIRASDPAQVNIADIAAGERPKVHKTMKSERGKAVAKI
jgi:hypothetical protein